MQPYESIHNLLRKIRLGFERNRSWGLYFWLRSFDMLLDEKRWRECRMLVQELYGGGYDLDENERIPVEDREYAFIMREIGMDRLDVQLKWRVDETGHRAGGNRYKAELLFRQALVRYRQNDFPAARDLFAHARLLFEEQGIIRSAGRVSRALAGLEQDATNGTVLTNLWEECFNAAIAPAKVLLEIAADASWRRQRDAVDALIEAREEDGVREFFSETFPVTTRLYATHAVRVLPPDIAIGFLRHAAHDSHWLIRWNVAHGLGLYHADEVGPLLINLIQDPDIDVRMAAVSSIQNARVTQGISSLEEIIKKPEEYDTLGQSLRRHARNVWEAFTGQISLPDFKGNQQ